MVLGVESGSSLESRRLLQTIERGHRTRASYCHGGLRTASQAGMPTESLRPPLLTKTYSPPPPFANALARPPILPWAKSPRTEPPRSPLASIADHGFRRRK